MRVRAGVAALLIAVVGLSLTGCNFLVEQWTTNPYDASDGVSARVGDVSLLNAIVISDDGENGNLIATAVNRGSDDVELVLQYESTSGKAEVTVDLPANSTTDIGHGDAGQLFLAGIDAAPGTLLGIYLQYGDEQGKRILVPVLDTAFSEYEGLLPTPTPTPEPTESATPEPASDAG